MTDIVERLEFDAARCEATFSKGVATNIEEAVAEIKALRANVERALDLAAKEIEKMERLTADNERLRAALDPFAWAARGMYVSGHCGGASPEDFPSRWIVHVSAGPHHISPQQWVGQQVLTVDDFRRAQKALSEGN